MADIDNHVTPTVTPTEKARFWLFEDNDARVRLVQVVGPTASSEVSLHRLV